MNAVNNNKWKKGIKKEFVEKDDMEHSYLGDENKDLIGNICKSKLKYDEDLSLTGFDNGKFSLI